MYDLSWSTRGDIARNRSQDYRAYDLGNIHAPVPVVPIQNHLVAPHTPEIHSQHRHVPRSDISSSPDGSISFDYPSLVFTDSSDILEHSLPLPPASPVSRAGGLFVTMNLNDAPVDINILPHWGCIYSI